MFSTIFLKRAMPFFITFLIGLFFGSLFVSSKLPVKEIETINRLPEKKLELRGEKKCVPIQPQPERFENGPLQQLREKYIKEREELKTWQKQNSDPPEPAKSNVLTKLRELEKAIDQIKKEIDELKELEDVTDDEKGVNEKLLYLEKCQEF